MLYESIDIPLEEVNQIDPNLLAIALIVIFAAAIVMMLLYMPSANLLSKLQNENKELKAQRDMYINDLSVELLRNGHTEQEVAQLLVDINEEHEAEIKAQQGRTRQASKRSEVFALLGEKLRRSVS